MDEVQMCVYFFIIFSKPFKNHNQGIFITQIFHHPFLQDSVDLGSGKFRDNGRILWNKTSSPYRCRPWALFLRNLLDAALDALGQCTVAAFHFRDICQSCARLSFPGPPQAQLQCLAPPGFEGDILHPPLRDPTPAPLTCCGESLGGNSTWNS